MRSEKINNLIDGKIFKYKEKLFTYIAKIIPSFITPNMITVGRVLLIIPIYFTYQQGAYIWMQLLFLLALFSDILDGVQARYYNKVSTLGKLLDPAADKIIFVGILLMIGPSRLSTEIIYVIIVLESLLVLLAVVIAPVLSKLNIKRELGANNAGKLKMTLEGLSIIILIFGLNNAFLIQTSEVILWIAAILALLSIYLHLTSKPKTITSLPS